MTQRQYDAATAQALMKLAYPEYAQDACVPYIFRDDGVYVNELYRQWCQSDTVFNWTPANEIDWADAPNPDTAPFLPIPFTASELAARLLDGPGYGVQSALNSRLGYPLDENALNSISARHRWMRDALHEAYLLAAAAQLIVGEYDYEEQMRAHKLMLQYDDADGKANDFEGVFEDGITSKEANVRRARAVASVAHLEAQASQQETAVADKWKVWRKAMVRQLLWPQKSADTASETAHTTNARVPVVADSASNAPKKARRDLLSPVIEASQRATENPLDAPAVWASLVQMAEAGKRPLLGLTEDGIKWQDANDEPQFFKFKNLRDRLRRSNRRTL